METFRDDDNEKRLSGCFQMAQFVCQSGLRLTAFETSSLHVILTFGKLGLIPTHFKTQLISLHIYLQKFSTQRLTLTLILTVLQ